MAEQLLAIARSDKNAIFLVGNAHINSLIKLLGSQGFILDNSDTSLGQNLITLKSNQAILSSSLIMSDILYRKTNNELFTIANYANSEESNSQNAEENFEAKADQQYGLLSYICEDVDKTDLGWQIKKWLYSKDIAKFDQRMQKYNIARSVDDLREVNSDFKTFSIDLEDKELKRDVLFVAQLKEKLNLPIGTKEIEYLQAIIYKTNIGFKVFDTIIDTARLIYTPTTANTKKVLIDTTYLYSIYSGVNGYSTIINGVDVVYKVYQGEYNQALIQALTTAAYMLAPVAISFVAIPYAGFVYGATLTIYSGYGAITNAYSFYQEYYEKKSGLKSITAYKNLFETLSNFPLQYAYDFIRKAKESEVKLNNIKLELDKTYIKEQLEEKGEFGRKLYEYIYVPMLEEKYELLNKIIRGILTEEEANQLKAKHIQILDYDHCMEIVRLREDQSDHYYCYNEEQQILDHMTIIGEAYIEKISSL